MNRSLSSVLDVHCVKSADGFMQLYFSTSEPLYIVHLQKQPRSVIDHAEFKSIAMGLVQEHVFLWWRSLIIFFLSYDGLIQMCYVRLS